MAVPYQAGQCWTYPAPAGLEDSRIVIGAIARFEGHTPIICCQVVGALQKRPDQSLRRVTIPFLPMSEEAFAETVTAQDGQAGVCNEFRQGYETWKGDPRGLTYFTVPYRGSLDAMIARQMSKLVGA